MACLLMRGMPEQHSLRERSPTNKANPGEPLHMNLTEYIDSRRDENLNELKEFLRIPSVSTRGEHKPDVERAAKWVAEKLRGAGLENIEIVPTKMHPLVYGESLRAPGKPTVLFYGHYDVQPAEPLEL